MIQAATGFRGFHATPSIKRVDRLKAASEDYKYLLDRGYRRSTALEFVCGHYRLGKKRRNRLVRSVYSKKEIEDHKGRRIPAREIKGEKVAVDGFNVLIGAECALGRGELIEAQDGFHRDALGIFGRYRRGRHTGKAVELILKALKKRDPSDVLILFDAQVSKSGELAAEVRKKMEELGLKGDARTSGNVDYRIKKLNRVTATADTAIIEKVDKAIDLVGEL